MTSIKSHSFKIHGTTTSQSQSQGSQAIYHSSQSQPSQLKRALTYPLTVKTSSQHSKTQFKSQIHFNESEIFQEFGQSIIEKNDDLIELKSAALEDDPIDIHPKSINQLKEKKSLQKFENVWNEFVKSQQQSKDDSDSFEIAKVKIDENQSQLDNDVLDRENDDVVVEDDQISSSQQTIQWSGEQLDLEIPIDKKPVLKTNDSDEKELVFDFIPPRRRPRRHPLQIQQTQQSQKKSEKNTQQLQQQPDSKNQHESLHSNTQHTNNIVVTHDASSETIELSSSSDTGLQPALLRSSSTFQTETHVDELFSSVIEQASQPRHITQKKHVLQSTLSNTNTPPTRKTNRNNTTLRSSKSLTYQQSEGDFETIFEQVAQAVGIVDVDVKPNSALTRPSGLKRSRLVDEDDERTESMNDAEWSGVTVKREVSSKRERVASPSNESSGTAHYSTLPPPHGASRYGHLQLNEAAVSRSMASATSDDTPRGVTIHNYDDDSHSAKRARRRRQERRESKPDVKNASTADTRVKRERGVSQSVKREPVPTSVAINAAGAASAGDSVDSDGFLSLNAFLNPKSEPTRVKRAAPQQSLTVPVSAKRRYENSFMKRESHSTTPHAIKQEATAAHVKHNAGAPFCFCAGGSARHAVLRHVSKLGVNCGRPFYTCSQPTRPLQCSFFQWADDTDSDSADFRQRRDAARDKMKSKLACQKGITESALTNQTEKTTVKTPNGSELNKDVIAILCQMMDHYKSVGKVNAAQFKTMGYSKAIGALRRATEKITTYEQAIKLYGIGEKIARKIEEISRTDHLRQLDFMVGSAEGQARQLFKDVWGAGPSTINRWIAAGYRTLDDVLSNKSAYTRQQEIGLRLYDDINARIPRAEVEEIQSVVAKITGKLDRDFFIITCGSYRRNKKDCGDVDLLITHPDGVRHVLKPLLSALVRKGYLTDHLSLSTTLDQDNDITKQEVHGTQSKYMGIFRLSPKHRHRRLDIITVPYNEFGCAMLYFTGSDYFNRSMRWYAKSCGMTLTQHCVAPAIRQGKDKIWVGQPLPDLTTEEAVFEALQLEYVAPEVFS